jgi:hypothetical protein
LPVVAHCPSLPVCLALPQDAHLRSFSHASYTTDGHREAAIAVSASHLHPRCAASLPASLLIAHDGELPTAAKYQSQHSVAFGAREDDRAQYKQLQAKAAARRGREEEEERERLTRDRTYRTVSSDSWSVEHSLVASGDCSTRSLHVVKTGGQPLSMPAAVLSLQLRK